MKYFSRLYFSALFVESLLKVYPQFHIAIGLYGHSNLKAMIPIAQPANCILSFLSVVSLAILDFRSTPNILVLSVVSRIAFWSAVVPSYH